MATSNLSLLLSISLTFFLLLLNKVNSSEITSFSFSKFHPEQKNLIQQGDTEITSNGRLQLTRLNDAGKPAHNSLGRALYAAPIHIRDRHTGSMANFVTSFNFVIDAPNNAKPAEGLTFFLAPVNTQPKKAGGLFGLFNDDRHSESYQTLCIEFDTYDNRWDPKVGPHMGIDVNSIVSRKTRPCDFVNAEVAEVIISYEASTKTLLAALVHPKSKTSYILTEVVNLNEVLPEYVNVGFSATTGPSEDRVETHDVLSWSFQSELPDPSGDENNKAHLLSSVLRRGFI